jgi:hypothetical protein
MGLITKGMGAVLKKFKTAKRNVASAKMFKTAKKGMTNPKTNAPLYAAGAIAVAQKVVREKLKSKKEWEPVTEAGKEAVKLKNKKEDK